MNGLQKYIRYHGLQKNIGQQALRSNGKPANINGVGGQGKKPMKTGINPNMLLKEIEMNPRRTGLNSPSFNNDQPHATTILSVRRGEEVIMAGDGQVTLGDTVMKQSAKKVRTMFDHQILAGFAGTSADAFTLFEKFEAKLDEYKGNLTRAAVELAKDWRTDKMLRHLEALLIVCDEKTTLVISGTGDVIEPDDGVIAIGSGGPYAQAAAKALLQFTELPLKKIAEEAMRLTAEICIFTNNRITMEELPRENNEDKKEG